MTEDKLKSKDLLTVSGIRVFSELEVTSLIWNDF